MVRINLFVDRMENGSSLCTSTTHTPIQIRRHTILLYVCVCLINGRERDESLHVYRFGKHARCACCKILLIYDYLLHIPPICARRALIAQLPEKHSGNKAKRYDVLDGRKKECCFRNRKPERNYMFNVSAIHFRLMLAVAAAATAAVAARAHRYLRQISCRISGCTSFGSRNCFAPTICMGTSVSLKISLSLSIMW